MMARFSLLVSAIMVFLVQVCADEHKKIIDLTRLYHNNMLTIPLPSHPPFNMSVYYKQKSDHEVYYQTNKMCLVDHTGTHLDAPMHFKEGERTIGDMPLTELIGNGVMLDITVKGEEDPDYIATMDDINKWEEEYGRIPDESIFFLNTGRHRGGDDWKAVFGVDDKGKWHVPGIDVEAVRWLIENRRIKLFGSDVGLDPGTDPTFSVHQLIQAEHSIGIIDLLTNLDQLPPVGSTVFAIPMNIRDGSGAPVRVFAMLNSGVAQFLSTNTILAALMWLSFVISMSFY